MLQQDHPTLDYIFKVASNPYDQSLVATPSGACPSLGFSEDTPIFELEEFHPQLFNKPGDNNNDSDEDEDIVTKEKIRAQQAFKLKLLCDQQQQHQNQYNVNYGGMNNGEDDQDNICQGHYNLPFSCEDDEWYAYNSTPMGLNRNE